MGLKWMQIRERIDELEYQAMQAKFSDPVARDIVCELATCLKEMAAEIEAGNNQTRESGAK